MTIRTRRIASHPPNEICPNGLLDMLNLPAPRGVCPRGRRLHLSGRDDPLDRLAAALSCRCWSCPVCASRLRREAGLHFGALVLECDEQLYVGRPLKWATDRKMLLRRGASWVRVTSVPFDDMLIGTAQLADGVQVGPVDAVRRLGKALRGVRRPDGADRYYPVTSSSTWEKPPRSPSRWEVVGGAGTVSQVIECLKRHGLDGKAKSACPGEGWLVAFHVPNDWPAAKIRSLES